MNKKLMIFLAIIVLFGFSGCISRESGKNVKKIDVSRLTGSERAVYETVDKYMTALKRKDAGTLVGIADYLDKFPVEKRKKISRIAVDSTRKILEETDFTIEKYVIDRIEMKEEFAYAYVYETSSVKTGNQDQKKQTRSIQDKFFVSKNDKGKWEISSIKILELASIDYNRIRNGEQLRELSAQFGVGQTFTLLIDSPSSLLFLQTDKSNSDLRSLVKYYKCQSNMEVIGLALEMYSVDNSGHYPVNGMKAVIPKYLKTIPTCPSAEKDTYSTAFKHEFSIKSFSFYCDGHYHKGKGIPENQLYYDNNEGLVSKPMDKVTD